jgi:DNA polymerase III subunit beta
MLDRSTTAAATAEISLRAGDLHDAFARTRHAICEEQTRYYLNGVYIHPSPDGKPLNFVATDGHRLAHVRVPIEPTSTFPPVLVDTDFVASAMKLLSRKSHQLLSAKLTLSPRAVSLADWQGHRIETEPVDCTYPDYARAVPENPAVRAVVFKQELIAALEPIAGFLRPTAQRAVNRMHVASYGALVAFPAL